MARAAAEPDEDGIPHPRQTTAFFGHEAAERTLLDAYRSGRIPHAWLIGGAPGIGKATLAFRMARFVLAHPDPMSAEVQSATSLAVPGDHAVTGLVAAQSHPDLLVLERTLSDTGKLRTVIRVDDARKVAGFLGATAGFGGWRIVIVDAVDDLNAESANALLKGLEEPPARTLFFLVSHAPGLVLPTIRSRCHRLLLRSLPDEALGKVLRAATGEEPEPALIAAAEGSVSRALSLSEGPAFKLRQQTMAQLARLPAIDMRELHALADSLAMADAHAFDMVMDSVNAWLSTRLAHDLQDKAKAAQLAEIWDQVNTAARDTDIYNLDRKPLIFRTFARLADAAAG
ncbi:DNA polymerase III subunit delta' [Pseudorhodoplanes sp.]|uniref:DNA polymerase III subunit delta' n=1 Tax=Pseudorhodoplanes sp. TaxID=1934341 RepID=UPI002CF17BF5|nr:DNA polymerase III subunit delta' [Pseudorhodoplanes sp.]HWV41033.1 DNA polymerase III subunit delta' [Pseudorhodoplanes sp.]